MAIFVIIVWGLYYNHNLIVINGSMCETKKHACDFLGPLRVLHDLMSSRLFFSSSQRGPSLVQTNTATDPHWNKKSRELRGESSKH